MFKLCVLSLSAIALIFATATNAANLEWPAGLLAVGPVKSTLQAVPVNIDEPLATSELADVSSGAATANPAPIEDDGELSESAEESAISTEEGARARVVSAIPVSVPLPLILASRAGLRTVLTIQEPTVAKVGEIVHHVPTAVSHQSQTIVHDHRRLVTPVVAPALRTTKLVRQQPPVVWTVAEPRVVVLQN